jgi:aspartyl-tRNA(Asn)/glutamyl-tRNA(Gln) amidotransferase subunit A
MPRFDKLPTLAAARRALLNKEISPLELVDAVAEKIAAHDPKIGAYLHLDVAKAREEASHADLSLPLGGLPIAIKDNINVQGQPTTCASKFLAGAYDSPYDATVIRHLRAAGAIPLGKLNMDEFAMGSTTENSALQLTHHPHHADYVPGGSSGGSAAAVAGNMALAALGSDTGGSIRQPAAFCGCVGLKPSYGRISRYGLVAFASSLDQIGPITQTVEDAALLLQAMAGPDIQDSTCLNAPVPSYAQSLHQGVKGLRIGMPKEYFQAGIHPEIHAAVEKSLQRLARQGAEIVPISLPHTDYAVATYYIIATAEASANLARFDGVRYGNRASDPQGMLDLYARSRTAGFGPEVKRRVLLGTYVLSSGYYDAYYLKAQKVRTLIMRDFLSAWEKVDVIASPATPQPSFRRGAKSQDPLALYLEDIFTSPANLAGICGISVPCGSTQATATTPALPMGLQLLGPSLGEAQILRVAAAHEALQPQEEN